MKRRISLVKPPRLQPGMTVGIIAPASAAREPESIDAALVTLHSLGLKTKVGRHARKKHGFLAAPDADRLADFHRMVTDPKVDAVMSVRGGYGTSRLAQGVDFELVQRNPKVIVGFSDLTYLELALLQKSRLVSFSGPMLTFTFADHAPRRFTVEGFLRTVGQTAPAGSIWQSHPEELSGRRRFQVVRGGKAGGPLVGGNLCLLTASMGTPFQVQTRGRIVFLEDIDEKPYSIDRMLTQLLSGGVLADAAGIVFGRNVPHKEAARLEKRFENDTGNVTAAPLSRITDREYEFSISEVVTERLRPLGIPVVLGLPFGHIKDHATLPQGVYAEMDADAGELIVAESAVV